jgi:hypothetical protein
VSAMIAKCSIALLHPSNVLVVDWVTVIMLVVFWWNDCAEKYSLSQPKHWMDVHKKGARKM